MRGATSINTRNYQMARNYPRFLFSNPKNTKTPGPFIVHLLEPRLVFKVITSQPTGDFVGGKVDIPPRRNLICLDTVYDTNQADKIIEQGEKWLESQIKMGQIRI